MGNQCHWNIEKCRIESIELKQIVTAWIKRNLDTNTRRSKLFFHYRLGLKITRDLHNISFQWSRSQESIILVILMLKRNNFSILCRLELQKSKNKVIVMNDFHIKIQQCMIWKLMAVYIHFWDESIPGKWTNARNFTPSMS